jgi:hypothetical protein
MNLRAGLLLTVVLTLTGCGGDDTPSPASFAPLHYDYLTKLRLNVGSIDIQDHSAPLGPDDISAQSPVTPAQALIQIGRDRLFAAGLLGQAQFVIDQASIVRGAQGALYGNMAVHLDVTTQGGARAGYAEARVARTHVPGSDSENMSTVLYDMTRQMADAMNVELEFQIKRSMGDFLAAAAVVPSAVTAVPLGPNGAPNSLPPASVSAPLPTPPSGPPEQNALPPETPPPSNVPAPDAPPMQMSPPPGYLHQPGQP